MADTRNAFRPLGRVVRIRRKRGSMLVLVMLAWGALAGCQSAAPTPIRPTEPAGRSTAATAVPTAASMPPAQPGATLNSLDVRLPPGTGRLSPAFSPDRTRYSLEVAGDISTIGLVPVATASDTVRIAVDGTATASGKQSLVGIAVGRSEIAVQVDAGDGSGHSTTYLLDVDRRDMRQVVERFLKLSYDDPATGETMGYRLFVPEHYDASRSYPLVLFLHGAGERGTDNEIQLTANEGATVWATPEEQAKHPAFVLAPQSPGSPRTRGWTSIATRGQPAPFDPQKELITAYDILQKVKGEYRIDPARIYVTGVSMGGFGTFAIAIAHPQEFAAIVPVCGGGDPRKLAAIAKLPIWIFHAAKDPTVGVGFSRNSVAALKHAKGHPKYTEYPAGTFFYPSAHNSWTSAYATVEMRDWMFEQSK